MAFKKVAAVMYFLTGYIRDLPESLRSVLSKNTDGSTACKPDFKSLSLLYVDA